MSADDEALVGRLPHPQHVPKNIKHYKNVKLNVSVSDQSHLSWRSSVPGVLGNVPPCRCYSLGVPQSFLQTHRVGAILLASAKVSCRRA